MKKLLLIAMILGLLAISTVARGTRHGGRRGRPSHDGGDEHSHSGSSSNSGSDPTSGSDPNSNSGSDSTSGSNSDPSSGSGSTSGSTSGSGSSSGSLMSDSLAAHNNERNAHGVPSLTWSATLAQSAQAYADTMAQTGTTGHSSGRVNVGENLAWGSGSKINTSSLAGLWINEKQDFIAGKNFPDCSTTGSWHDVAHYTQMMWKKTTEVGCGLTQASSGRYYYVCHYSPQGNINGNPVY